MKSWRKAVTSVVSKLLDAVTFVELITDIGGLASQTGNARLKQNFRLCSNEHGRV